LLEINYERSTHEKMIDAMRVRFHRCCRKCTVGCHFGAGRNSAASTLLRSSDQKYRFRRSWRQRGSLQKKKL